MKDSSKYIIRNILQGENSYQDERVTDQGLNVYITGLTILMVLLVFVPFKSMGAEHQLTSIGPIEVGTTIRGEGYCLKFNIGSNRAAMFKLTIGENPPVPGGNSGPFFKNGAWWGGWDSGNTPTTFWHHSFCATTPSTIYYYILSIYDPRFEKYEYMTGAALTAQMDLKITLEALTLHDDSDDLSGCECEFHAYVNNAHLFQYGDQSNDNWISSGDVRTISGFEHYLFDVGRNKETITLRMRGCDLDDPSGFFLDPETWTGTTHDCAERSIEIPFSSYRQEKIAHHVSAGGDLSFTALFGTEPRYISRLTSSGQVYQEEHVTYPPPEIMVPTANSVHWDSKPVSVAVLVTYPADLRLKLAKEESLDIVYKMENISKTALELQSGLLVGQKSVSVEPGRYLLDAQASMSKESGNCPSGWNEEGGKCFSTWSKSVVFTVWDKEALKGQAMLVQKKSGIKGEIGKRAVEKYESEQTGMKVQPVPIIKGSKRSYRSGEMVVFEMKGDTGKAPVVECLDNRRWTTRCPRDLRLQKMGTGAQTRYILRASKAGKYRLRVGKVVSDEIEVKKAIDKKTALIKPSKKVTDTKKEPGQVSPTIKREPQKKTHRKLVAPVFKNLASGEKYKAGDGISFKIKPSPSSKGFKIKYELYRNACKGNPFKVSHSGNFGTLGAGCYCVRVGYLGGNWSDGIPFVVEEKKLKVKKIKKKMIITPKKNIAPCKKVVTH